MRFYTWKDVDRYCLLNCDKWESIIASIDVYPDEIIIYVEEEESIEAAKQALVEIFPRNIKQENWGLRLDDTNEVLDISFETVLSDIKKTKLPLFKQVIYNKSSYPDYSLSNLSCQVVAFHSYKGGVGRTLSLLAFAKAWANLQEKNNSGKILIIDSDLEAPGLSWIQDVKDENAFSYLDLLTLIQDEDDIDIIVKKAAEKIGGLSISIETEEKKVEHIFLPAFRYAEQLFDMYASPDSVIRGRNKTYILADVLSKIAIELGASLVLVDLRAGVSEYSAPLLFDPRVKKYFVTSTSEQSIIGTEKVLEYIAKGLPITEDSNLPTILLSMVPETISLDEKHEMIKKLIHHFNVDDKNVDFLDNMVVELPFASELVHLTNIQQITNALKGRKMYENIEKIVNQYFACTQETIVPYTASQRDEILRKIHDFSELQITAEANGEMDLFLTKPIKNLCARFSLQIPISVVRGTKGSGKTFLYRQLIAKKTWSAFCSSIDNKYRKKEDGYFLPVLAPKNTPKINEIIKSSIDTFNNEIEFAEVSKSVYLDNSRKLEENVDQQSDWVSFWEDLLVSSVNKKCTSFDELSKRLLKENKRAIFLIDGLEEILRSVSTNKSQQDAVRILCQDIVNMLSARYDNIGIIIFLRSDMAQNAITVNFEQFKQAHSYADLKWSSEEALKLAVWVVQQAVDDFYESDIPIQDALEDVIDKHLAKLWGVKLGKETSNEAYSSRWILAALSDFNRQIQARDIIRFLKYAAQPNSKKVAYEDRILMPTEIRNAVSTCSKEKIDEIKAEYEGLKPIFEKLEQLDKEKKVLPLSIENDIFTANEEKQMMQEGYLTRDGDKLYLPEIIRHALGFKYDRGARPRVLSLLL